MQTFIIYPDESLQKVAGKSPVPATNIPQKKKVDSEQEGKEKEGKQNRQN